MSDSVGAKPRVLLSILKGEGFDMLGDASDLFTTIQAGFGKFECERVLKPSGVELMNLAQSAIIEIIVQRRDKDGGEPRMLFRGRIPLANLNQGFFGRPCDANGFGGIEPQAWESWLGLFSADVSMKVKTQDQIFQQCLDMGNAPARSCPRLFLRLQYLHAGAPPPPRAPATSTQGALGPSMETSMRAEMNVQQVGNLTPKMFSTGGMLAPSIQDTPTGGGAYQPGSRIGALAATAVPIGSEQRRNTPPDQLRSPHPIAEVSGVPASWVSQGMAVRNVSPTGGSTPGQPGRPGSPLTGTPLLAGPARTAPGPTVGSPPLPPSWNRPRSGSRPDNSADASPIVGAGVNWRAQCDQLKVEAMERSQAYDELEAEADNLRKMVAESRLAKEELEQQNLRLHADDAARDDILKNFFGRVSPTLTGLGWPLHKTPAEAAATPGATSTQLEQIVTALADTLKARESASATSSALAVEEVGLLGEAVWQAVEGGETAFEDWFSSRLDAPARARLANATRLLSGCRQAASLRTAAAASNETATQDVAGAGSLICPVYLPVKTDPVDLLIASTLLNLTTDQTSGSAFAVAAAGLLRLEPGKYRLGPQGPRITCYMESGRVLVQVPSGNANEAHHEPMELADFLARGVAAETIPGLGFAS